MENCIQSKLFYIKKQFVVLKKNIIHELPNEMWLIIVDCYLKNNVSSKLLKELNKKFSKTSIDRGFLKSLCGKDYIRCRDYKNI